MEIPQEHLAFQAKMWACLFRARPKMAFSVWFPFDTTRKGYPQQTTPSWGNPRSPRWMTLSHRRAATRRLWLGSKRGDCEARPPCFHGSYRHHLHCVLHIIHILTPPAQAADITGLLSYLQPFGIVRLPSFPAQMQTGIHRRTDAHNR